MWTQDFERCLQFTFVQKDSVLVIACFVSFFYWIGVFLVFFLCLICFVLLWNLSESLPFCFTALPLKLMKIQEASAKCDPHFFSQSLYLNVIQSQSHNLGDPLNKGPAYQSWQFIGRSAVLGWKYNPLWIFCLQNKALQKYQSIL